MTEFRQTHILIFLNKPPTRHTVTLINTITNFYAERIEPITFLFRRSERLRVFGLDNIKALPTATLVFIDACEIGRLCQRLVNLYRKYYGRYAQRNPDGRLHRLGGVAAILPLGDFHDYGAYVASIRKRSGYFARKARKASETGYFVDIFNRANQTPDILAIRKSMKFRAFGPVLDAFFLTLKGLGDAPVKLRNLKEVDCSQHWEICLGVFLDKPGYCQGDVVVDRQLVAYVRLHRVGNVVRYADFMGHGEHLAKGVMMLLQLETMRWLMAQKDPTFSGIQYVTYGAIEQGAEGLLFWKRKALFRPMLLELSA